mgnify:FL=1
MSSHKEKAEDLVNSFRMILMDEDTDCGEEILCSLIAIKMATISVNEILKSLNELPDAIAVKWQRIHFKLVKEELEKL